MKLFNIAGGFAAGLSNGLLGSGGGMIAVPTLRAAGLDTRRAHSSSIAVVLPISAVSAGLYLYGGHAAIADALPYIPGGIIGALIGGRIMKRIEPKLLRRIFGGFAVWAGVRMLLR